MKKYFLILLLFSAFFGNAQTTLANKLKVTAATKKNDATRLVVQDSLTKEYHWMLKNNFLFSEGTPAMIQGSVNPHDNDDLPDLMDKYLPRQLFYFNNTDGKLYTFDFGSSDWVQLGGGPAPTLQAVTESGNTTDQQVTFEDGLTVQGDLFHKNASGFISEDIISGLTANRTYVRPNASGTLPLISNFINDGDSTHSPDGNTVYDALALKANDSNSLHKTGNETITSGYKSFADGSNIGIEKLATNPSDAVGHGGSFFIGNRGTAYDRFDFLSKDNDIDSFGKFLMYANVEEGLQISKSDVSNSQVISASINNGSFIISGSDGPSNNAATEFSGYGMSIVANSPSNSNTFTVNGDGTFIQQPLYLWDAANADFASLSITDNQIIGTRWDDSLFYTFSNNSGFNAYFSSDGISAHRSYTFPDYDGKVAIEDNLRGINGVQLYDGPNDNYATISSSDGDIYVDNCCNGRLATFSNSNFTISNPTSGINASLSTDNIASGNRTYYLPDTDGELATVKCLTYTAFLTQTSTDDPVVTVFDNSIGNIVWTRTSAGHYDGTLTGAFTENKTWTVCNNGFIGQVVSIFRASANVISIQTQTGSSTYEDDILNTSIEIRIYP